MSQLRSGVLKFTICLRCQHRLRSWRGRSSQHYQSQPLRHFARVHHLHQELTDFKGAEYHEDSTKLPIITYESYEASLKAPPSRYRHISKDSLGFESLGEPAEVLIIRERQKKEKRHDSVNEDQSLQTDDGSSRRRLSSSAMLEEMNAERGIIDIDRVCKNIDAVRNEWIGGHSRLQDITEGVVSLGEYDDLALKLHSGFTANQLAAYLERNERVHPVDPLDLHHQYSSALYSRSSWTSGTADVWRARPPDLAEVGPKIHDRRSVREKPKKQPPPKTFLVHKILRHCWHIRPEADQYTLGEMDVRMQSAHLDLLVNHSKDATI